MLISLPRIRMDIMLFPYTNHNCCTIFSEQSGLPPRKLAQPPSRTIKMNLSGQDWDTVVLRKKPPTTAQATSAKAVNAAIRAGMW